ncbi:MAG: hypothetical protein LBI17_01975 [Rickettsiales bacterium]|jgi:hypothetical protein|nr:hypothetical protein [Rickettsiales bacterium]
MKRILLLLMFMSSRMARAEDAAYALVVLQSGGSVAESLLSTQVAGGNLDMSDSGAPAKYRKKDCVSRMRVRLADERAYSTMFRYMGGGAYSAGGAYGRMICVEYDVARKYWRRSTFWNFDAAKFFKDFGDKVPDRFVPADFAKYGVFPLDGNDDGLTAALDSDMNARAKVQKTSFDCAARPIGRADDMVCHDGKLAALDVKVAALYNGLAKKYDFLVPVKTEWDIRRRATFYPAGLEAMYGNMLSYLECVKEKEGADGCALEEF